MQENIDYFQIILIYQSLNNKTAIIIANLTAGGRARAIEGRRARQAKRRERLAHARRGV